MSIQKTWPAKYGLSNINMSGPVNSQRGRFCRQVNNKLNIYKPTSSLPTFNYLLHSYN